MSADIVRKNGLNILRQRRILLLTRRAVNFVTKNSSPYSISKSSVNIRGDTWLQRMLAGLKNLTTSSPKWIIWWQPGLPPAVPATHKPSIRSGSVAHRMWARPWWSQLRGKVRGHVRFWIDWRKLRRIRRSNLSSARHCIRECGNTRIKILATFRNWTSTRRNCTRGG